MTTLNIAGRRERLDGLVTPAVAGGGVRENSASVHVFGFTGACKEQTSSYHAGVCQRHTDNESDELSADNNGAHMWNSIFADADWSSPLAEIVT